MFRKISIILASFSIFLALYGMMIDLIIYRNDPNPQTYELAGFNFEGGVYVTAAVCGIIAFMLFLIISNNLREFVGGAGLVLLGLFHLLIAAGMNAEISSLIAHGPKPYLLLFLMTPQNLVTGLLLLLSGILAILAGVKEKRALLQGKNPPSTRRFNNPGPNP